MSTRVTRNTVVAMLGTPDRTVGSLNSPVELEELGVTYNEKWIYEHLVSDPAGVPLRAIYWHRYDFVSTVIRGAANEEWRPDTKLIEAVAAENDRLAPIEDCHEALTPSGLYAPASEVKDATDLGGYIMGQKPSPAID
ncbi:MAG TPA: hypothetical protein VHS07_01885 [Candidatus Binataceae bacterium]|jgi:hypothetical protein|nr:hypothetical protein [Candidatus Binataceae bacterium]